MSLRLLIGPWFNLVGYLDKNQQLKIIKSYSNISLSAEFDLWCDTVRAVAAEQPGDDVGLSDAETRSDQSEDVTLDLVGRSSLGTDTCKTRVLPSVTVGWAHLPVPCVRRRLR